ncbi:hypothetical protein CLAIMM_13232 isoform 1 [Cladophialophora immunda]|nr:hypothetical protein CLAIMM_13232 isoform 1 [Cladophialophora immunda]
MHVFSLLAVSSLPLAALAAPYQVSLADFTNLGDGKVTPAWLRENEQLVVPLSPLARTGLVDPLVEEGLISLAGNYFFNKIYEHANDSDMSAAASWRCIKECGTTVATSVPCLFAALAGGGRPEDALKCVGKKTLCGCRDCLPKPIDNWLQQKVCSSAVVEVADKFSPYVDFSALAGSSVSVSAFRVRSSEIPAAEERNTNKKCSG